VRSSHAVFAGSRRRDKGESRGSHVLLCRVTGLWQGHRRQDINQVEQQMGEESLKIHQKWSDHVCTKVSLALVRAQDRITLEASLSSGEERRIPSRGAQLSDVSKHFTSAKQTHPLGCDSVPDNGDTKYIDVVFNPHGSRWLEDGACCAGPHSARIRPGGDSLKSCIFRRTRE
jgi:hypothetical protein